MNYSAKNIAQMLAKDAERVAKYLFPQGKLEGNEWCVGSLSGELGRSLKVCVRGNKAGLWRDFAGNENEKGDLLELWRQIRNVTISEAISEIKQWMGIASPQFLPNKRLEQNKPVLQSENRINPSSKVARYLIEQRKLSFETLHEFKIMECGNEIVFPYYSGRKLVMMKYLRVNRSQGNKEIRTNKNPTHSLFGWQAIPHDARSVVIVEGEIDAMTLHQYRINIAVLSVPFGGGAGNKQHWIENEYDALASFDEVYLCLDNDEAGQAATNEIINRLGRHRCRIVTLPFKDANECLLNGVSKEEVHNCFKLAKILDPDELKPASIFVDQVTESFYPTQKEISGYSLPWSKADSRVYFRPGELSVHTGTNGHGKSQILGQISLSCMLQGAKVCIASLEIKPQRLLERLTRQASGLRTPTQEYIRAIHDWYDGKLWIYDLIGTAKTKRLLDVFRYARKRYGIDVFIIDSLMKCGISEDDYNAQKSFVEELCDFKHEFDCHVHLVVHPRKQEDESKPPGKLDIKGTGAITDLADNCFTVWRNKIKEEERSKLGITQPSKDLTEKFDCLFYCTKQRNGEWEGKLTLWFDKDSFQYLESPKHRPIQMVDFSNVVKSSILH